MSNSKEVRILGWPVEEFRRIFPNGGWCNVYADGAMDFPRGIPYVMANPHDSREECIRSGTPGSIIGRVRVRLKSRPDAPR